MLDYPLIHTCKRCGWTWAVNATRNKHENCLSCRAQKAQRVKDCIAWDGDFAEDLITPITENGDDVMPGARSCDNRDCVNPAHIDKLS